MTKSRSALWGISLLAFVWGLASVIGAFAFEDITLQYKISGFMVGALLLAGAGLLLSGRKGGVVLLSLSAIIYAAVLMPAFQRHGADALSHLMSTFYFTLAFRFGLATAAFVIVRGRYV
jgi:hypothetical protein